MGPPLCPVAIDEILRAQRSQFTTRAGVHSRPEQAIAHSDTTSMVFTKALALIFSSSVHDFIREWLPPQLSKISRSSEVISVNTLLAPSKSGNLNLQKIKFGRAGAPPRAIFSYVRCLYFEKT